MRETDRQRQCVRDRVCVCMWGEGGRVRACVFECVCACLFVCDFGVSGEGIGEG